MVGVEHFVYRDEPVPTPSDGDILVPVLYPAPGPANLFELITRRVRMEGFLISDFADFAPRFGEARRALEGWLDAGQLKAHVDVREGFENIPKTFLRIFSGANIGRQTLKIADPPLPVGR